MKADRRLSGEPVRTLFLGSGAFAVPILDALVAAPEVRLVGVVAAPDRPSGRRAELTPVPVARRARELDLPLLQPARLRAPDAVAEVAALQPELGVLADYGQIVPSSILTIPAHGILNVHPSALPRYRGAAPIPATIVAGDPIGAVTLIRMDEGLDTGPILLQETLAISPDDTCGTLHDRLGALGAKLLVQALASNPAPRPQDCAAATYAARIGKDEAGIDWRRPAVEIERQVRAFDPAPGAQTQCDGVTLKIWHARVEPGAAGAAGIVSAAGADGIVVACGGGALRITELQRAGGKRLPAQAFLSGFKLERGARLGAADG